MTKKILEKAANNIVGDYTKQAQVQWNKMVKKFMIENQSINSTVTIEFASTTIEVKGFTNKYIN